MTEQAAGRRRLRDFGLIVGGILLFWGALRLYRGRGYGVPALPLGGVLCALGLLVPQALQLPYRAWTFLGHILGAINTRLLLFLTFWLVMTPLGLLRRLFAGSALASRPTQLPSGGKSYFQKRKPDERGVKHFENMF